MKSSRSFARLASLVLAIGLMASACTKKSEDASATAAAGSLQGTKVHLAAWSNYVSPEVLAEFTKQTGIQVEIGRAHV